MMTTGSFLSKNGHKNLFLKLLDIYLDAVRYITRKVKNKLIKDMTNQKNLNFKEWFTLTTFKLHF